MAIALPEIISHYCAADAEQGSAAVPKALAELEIVR